MESIENIILSSSCTPNHRHNHKNSHKSVNNGATALKTPYFDSTRAESKQCARNHRKHKNSHNSVNNGATALKTPDLDSPRAESKSRLPRTKQRARNHQKHKNSHDFINNGATALKTSDLNRLRSIKNFQKRSRAKTPTRSNLSSNSRPKKHHKQKNCHNSFNNGATALKPPDLDCIRSRTNPTDNSPKIGSMSNNLKRTNHNDRLRSKKNFQRRSRAMTPTRSNLSSKSRPKKHDHKNSHKSVNNGTTALKTPDLDSTRSLPDSRLPCTVDTEHSNKHHRHEHSIEAATALLSPYAKSVLVASLKSIREEYQLQSYISTSESRQKSNNMPSPMIAQLKAEINELKSQILFWNSLSNYQNLLYDRQVRYAASFPNHGFVLHPIPQFCPPLDPYLTNTFRHQEQQQNPKKRKADVLQATIPDTPTDNTKPLSTPSSWTRPNPFSGGYSNAIPFLEEFTQITTPMLQQSHPNLFPSNSATVFIHTLTTVLAHSVNSYTYLLVLIAANQLSAPVISAVPRDYLLKETPFRSTGPGPPPGVSSQIFLNNFLDFSIFLKEVTMFLVRDDLVNK